MSEKLNTNSPEQNLPSIEASAESKKNLERINQEALEAASQKTETEELTREVQETAASGKEISLDQNQSNAGPSYGEYHDAKRQNYKRTMAQVRRRLSPAERTMSKFMHAKSIDSTSEVLSKTIARPSGILGAGVFALFGNSILLYMAKTYGFEHNFFVYFLLIAVGYVAGITLESVVRTIAKLRR